ncbi:hypothetical protein Trco_002125 [Trichoderma cornu-damae]|uniref:Uncharacterized protein n=1 Tax=Trichoderma cornu-damae TaxID=654480 RepID=A0A9P8TXJ0_9HYPO|nr:hypothetical protein Trco_002125 [Trichoderma cornu-damae]
MSGHGGFWAPRLASQGGGRFFWPVDSAAAAHLVLAGALPEKDDVDMGGGVLVCLLVGLPARVLSGTERGWPSGWRRASDDGSIDANVEMAPRLLSSRKDGYAERRCWSHVVCVCDRVGRLVPALVPTPARRYGDQFQVEDGCLSSAAFQESRLRGGCVGNACFASPFDPRRMHIQGP